MSHDPIDESGHLTFHRDLGLALSTQYGDDDEDLHGVAGLILSWYMPGAASISPRESGRYVYGWLSDGRLEEPKEGEAVSISLLYENGLTICSSRESFREEAIRIAHRMEQDYDLG